MESTEAECFFFCATMINGLFMKLSSVEITQVSCLQSPLRKQIEKVCLKVKFLSGDF